MLKKIKTIEDLEQATEIQEWSNGCETFDDMVNCICDSTSLDRDSVVEWAQEEVEGYFYLYGEQLFND